MRSKSVPIRFAPYTIAACLAALLATSDTHGQTTNWVAFNDHAPGTGTAPNTTTYNMRGISGGNAGTVLSGNLKDITSGASVAAVFTSSAVGGTPNDLGSMVVPNAGTDAYNLFNGIVDLSNSQSGIGVKATGNIQTIHTLSGLDPNKRYVFKGTAVRGNNYAGRWTLVTIEGADSFSDDHSAVGAYTSANFPSAALTAGQVGFQSGENRTDGTVVGWKEIAPGADGSIAIRCQQWNPTQLPNGSTADLANYGYAICGMMLAEVETGPPQAPIIITQPANVITNEGAIARLSVAAAGSGTLTYQWFRGSSPIPAPAGTGTTLTITNMNASSPYPWSLPSDSGSYHVEVTGIVAPPAVSSTATVTVNPDTNAPRFLWAISDTNAAGHLVIRVALSEPLANLETDLREVLFWNVLVTSGPGPDLGGPISEIPTDNPIAITNVVFANTNTLEIQLTYFGFSLDPSTSYKVTFDGGAVPIIDRSETPNAMLVHEAPLHSKPLEPISLNSEWRYSGLDVPPPGNWWEAGYDDSDGGFWTPGNGPFDAKREGCRTIALHNLGPVGTCLVWSNDLAPAVITNYYFRTHFNYPGQPQANGMMILNGKFDDGGVIYLNGQEIVRLGMPAGPLEHTNYANRTVGDSDLQDVSYFSPGSALKSGDNVVAVRMAQVNLS
ncbi:MAG TPA: hypothetical protein VK530_18045, partial [Candidatus Acidoferrum sp.]|nr:hypothetical protein [Candidatus Acidoferrum sp.]